MTVNEAITVLECMATNAVGALAQAADENAQKVLGRRIDALDLAIEVLSKSNGKEDGDGLSEYEIPDDIKERIPEYFYYALGGECVSLMGKGTLICDEDGLSPLDYLSGSAGCEMAIKATCRKLNMDWLDEYREQLTWEQCDMFNRKLADETMRRFNSDDDANSYHLYLLTCEK